MPGGLIQLAVTGIQDAPLSYKPEITFFKTVYKKYTQFTINQQLKYIGSKKFNSTNQLQLDKNGDLLYGQFFKLEIPYFDIITNTSPTIVNTFNITQLSVMFQDNMCIMIYYNNNWYLIPEYLFNLPSLTSTIYDIDANSLSDNLLPQYIKEIDIGDNIFAAGQAYTALSRAQSLSSICIKSISKKSFITKDSVLEFYSLLGCIKLIEI